MKVIVTGGAGFIGCNAASRFLRRGDTVVVIDNMSRPGVHSNLEWLRGQGDLQFLELDIRDAKQIAFAFLEHRDAGLILHLAGQVAVTTSVTNPREDFEINALGTFNVLEAARGAGIKAPVIFSSTNKVYGGMEEVGVVERDGHYAYADLPTGVSEEQNLDFHSPYGCSKGAADQYVRDYASHLRPRTVVFRQSCIYGYRQFGIEDQGWVAWFTIAAQLGKPITSTATGSRCATCSSSTTSSTVFEAAARNIDRAAGRVYNVGGGPSNMMSLLDLLDYLGERAGEPIAHAHRRLAPRRPTRVRQRHQPRSRGARLVAQGRVARRTRIALRLGRREQRAVSVSDNGKLRVLHVGKYYPPYMGGIETHLQTLCHAIRDDVHLEVVVSNVDGKRVDDVVDGVAVTRVATPFHFAAAPISPGLVGRIRRSRADVVHLHHPNPVAILAYLASGHRGRLVVTYHSDIVRQKVLGSAFEPLVERAMRRASAIIATSPNYLATSTVLQRHKDRSAVIPYGIEIDEFERVDEAAVRDVRERLGSRLVITVGRLIYYKGFDWLIRAMKSVDGTLVIVGDGPLRSSLEALAREIGVADRVVFLGEVQNRDVIPYYHASDVFALASVARSEAFGIVQIEAMACGKPVVNTSLDSGVPFVSLDGVTGKTVPPRDEKALASALTELLDDAELRATLGAAARRRAREEFHVSVMARRTLDLYRSVVASS